MSEERIALDWKEGPSRGGGGTAGVNKEGIPLWHDGDLLFVIVETNSGHEYSVITVSADEEHLAFYRQDDGENWDAWSDRDIAYWAKLDERHFPPTGKEQG